MESNEIVRKFYDENVDTEWARLERHPIEFAISSHYLKRYIRPGDRVLDVGGGPGRYSLMLVEYGCDVTLVDLSPENVAFAQGKAREQGLALTALAGDACIVDQLVSGPFDHVLLMGPLYHLMTDASREAAIRACRSVLKDRGTIYASIITLGAGALYFLQYGPELILDPGEEIYLEKLEAGQSFTGPAFTEAHFMDPKLLIPLMEAQGFETLHRVNCEGLCSPKEQDILALGQKVVDRWLALSLSVCEREEYSGFAEHLLYIGKKQSAFPA